MAIYNSIFLVSYQNLHSLADIKRCHIHKKIHKFARLIIILLLCNEMFELSLYLSNQHLSEGWIHAFIQLPTESSGVQLIQKRLSFKNIKL